MGSGEYGGKAVLPPVQFLPGRQRSWSLFPGGHASSGQKLVMGLFFAFWRERPRVSPGVLYSSAGVRSGDGALVRSCAGRIFSHNLWAGWWVWFSQVAVYGLVSASGLLKSKNAMLW